MQTFDDLLDFDPMDAAQQRTGLDYKTDPGTYALGALLLAEHKERVRDELMLRQDTYYGMPFSDAVDTILDLGFQPVLVREIVEADRREQSILYWKDGVLVHLDSYRGKSNSITLWFNLDVHHVALDDGSLWGAITSGHLTKDNVWIGQSNGSVALRHTMDKLRSIGSFRSTWTEAPTWSHRGLRDVTEDMVSTLPDEVKAAILS